MEEKKRSKRKEDIKQDKTRYQMIIDGDVEPEGPEKGWNNLQPEKYSFAAMDKDRLREISKKGGQAVQKIYGEKKTARESLEKILTLKINDEIIAGADLDPAMAERLKRSNPDITIYDLIQIVAAGRAVGGNIKAAEYIRDTYGDKPTEKLSIDGAEIITEKDRDLLQKISSRLEDPGLIIAKDIATDDQQDQ